MFHAAFLGMVGKPAGCSLGEVMYRLVSGVRGGCGAVVRWCGGAGVVAAMLLWQVLRQKRQAWWHEPSSTHPCLLVLLLLPPQDSMYGRPGAGLRRRFHGMVKRILDCQGWDEVRRLLQTPQLPELLACTGRASRSQALLTSALFSTILNLSCPARPPPPPAGFGGHGAGAAVAGSLDGQVARRVAELSCQGLPHPAHQLGPVGGFRAVCGVQGRVAWVKTSGWDGAVGGRTSPQLPCLQSCWPARLHAKQRF